MVFVVVAAATIPAVAQDIDSAREQVAETEALIADARARADEATGRFWEAEIELDVIAADIDQLGLRVDTAQAELDLLADEMRAFAVERYTGESVTPELFDQEDLNRYSVMSYLARDLQIDNVDVIDTFRLVQANLDAATSELEDRMRDQEQFIDELAQARSDIDAELAFMSAQLEQQEQVLAQLEEEERRRIEAEIAERRRREQAERARVAAERSAAEAARRAATTTTTTPPGTTIPGQTTTTPRDVPTGPIATGNWVCPVQGAVSFTDTYGQARGGGRRHQGVDMMAATGTPVVAPVAGTVTHRDNSIGGRSFHIEGSDGNYYYGTHLDSYGNSGSVQAGVIIGYVGSSGNATTPHLHFEIHQGGRGNSVNPTPTVAQFC